MIGITGTASWCQPLTQLRELARQLQGDIDKTPFSIIAHDHSCWSVQICDENLAGSIAEGDNVTVLVVGDIYDDELVKSSGLSKATYLHNIYLQRGMSECAGRNGSYLFLIADLSRQQLFLGTDENSVIPVYYAIQQDTLSFSWDVSAVLKSLPNPPSLDYQVLFSWLLMGGRGFGDETRFEGVKRLEPGSILSLCKDSAEVYRSTPFSFMSDGSSEEQLVADAIECINLAVDRRVSSCDNILVGLSGGIDSRIILAAAVKFTERITCFTFGKEDFAEKDIADEVARYFDLPHVKIHYDDFIYLPHAKDGVFYSAGASLFKHGIQTHLYAALKSQHESQGLMLGSALDLLVGGTFCPDAIFELERRDQLLAYYSQNLFNLSREQFVGLFQSSSIAETFYDGAEETLRTSLDRIPGDEPADVNDAFAFDVRIKRWYNHNLIYPLYSHRLLFPTYDHDFLKVMARVPSPLRKDSHFRIQFLSTLHPELAEIRYDSTMQPASLLPPYSREFQRIQRQIDRLKEEVWVESGGKVYLPSLTHDANFMEWFRVHPEYQTFLSETLVGSGAVLCELFLKREKVQELIDAHVQGKHAYHKVLVMLLSMELTCRVFVNSEAGVNYSFVDFSQYLGVSRVD